MKKKAKSKIDSKVRPIVNKLNAKEIKTYFSCQGHPRKGKKANAYIIYSKNKQADRAFEKAGFTLTKIKLGTHKDLTHAETFSKHKKILDKKWLRANKEISKLK